MSARSGPTHAELAVLRTLWRGGDVTVRELRDELYPDAEHAGLATVQSLLERLEAKGLALRERGARAHRWSAAVGRGELVGRRLRDIADTFCDGSRAPLLTGLVDGVELTEDEAKALETLVERLDGQGREG